MDDIGKTIGGIVAAIVGLAVLAIIISSRANTANVIGAFFGGVTNLIGIAVSPVTGQSVSGLAGGGGFGPGLASNTTGFGGTSGFAINPAGILGSITGTGGVGSLLGGSGGGGGGILAGLLGGGGGGGGGGILAGLLGG